MASNYGLNFGFRRSDESLANREGRLRTPATGNPLRIGSLVTFDDANPGYLKQAAASAVGEGGTVGLLVQEEQMFGSIYGRDPMTFDSFDLGLAKLNTLSAIWSGAGVKVWFKNTDAVSRADGRQIAAVEVVDLTDAAVLGYLTWDGTQFTATGATAANSMLRVTNLDTDNGFVEAVLTR